MIDPFLAGGLLAAAGYFASTLLPFPGIHEALAPGALFRTPAPWVALTFDDGPHPERTPRILDALAAAGALATFFVVGRQVRRLPELARRIARDGHTIGNHTDLHAWQPGLSTRSIGQQIDAAQAAVADVTGTLPSLVRIPAKPITRSAARRSPIPEHADHRVTTLVSATSPASSRRSSPPSSGWSRRRA